MITPNSKVTALEILHEVGIKDAEAKFGKMRVRIGGIAGINSPDRVITIQPGTTNLEVIVGAEAFDLELAKGNKENNAEVLTVSEGAKEVIEARAEELNAKAEHLQAVKSLARKIRAAEDADEDYKPSADEKDFLDEALDMVDAQREAEEVQGEEAKEVKRVKSK